MCAQKWADINYSHVPSVAAARYQKAFKRHDPVGYAAYAEKLTKKSEDVKINASVVFPHDVVRSLKRGDAAVALAQWEALPNFLTEGNMMLPVCDVSGSMMSPVGGNTTALDVCISLGLYLADKQTGPFKDMFLTFSGKSHLQVLSGDLQQKMSQLSSSDWGMNTSLESAFSEILRVAKQGKVAEKDMPKYLLVLSDMDFDACVHDGEETNFENAKKMFAAHGYKLPNVIFWNLNGRAGNVPVKKQTKNVALVSGFSPAIMKSVLAAEAVTPLNIMKKAVEVERYDVFGGVEI